jgi:type I restriction-modification system DNA methylase subunit
LDPACGSGAFLVYVFDFLLAENKRVGEILGDLFSLETYVRDILQNNIYGVDLNDESVEITKLSLWLKTAQKGKKLTALDKNIRCGNSLIDDENIAGRTVFNWQKEFKEIFENGGFDVVVGNPPYFNIQTLGAHSKEAEFIQNKFSQIWQDKSDILFYFFYLALKISKGAVGFITSNAYLFSDKAQKLRNFIIEDGRLKTIVNFEKYLVFADASITSCISIFNKNKKDTCAFVLTEKNYKSDEINSIINNPQNSFKVSLKANDVFALVDNRISKLNAKIDGRNPKLQELVKMGKGMETAADGVFLFEQEPKQFPEGFIKKRVTGENIERYLIKQEGQYILYFEDIENFDDLPQSIQEHLKNNKDELKNRATFKNECRVWWRYSRPMHREFYHLPKLYCSRRAFHNTFCYDGGFEYLGFSNMTVIFETNPKFSIKYILALLNSKLLNFRYKSIGKQTGGGSFEYFPNGVGKLPIVVIVPADQKPIIELVDKLMKKINERQKLIETFGGLLVLEFNLKKLSPNWWTLKFPDFVSALKVKLSLAQKDELLQLFNKYQQKLAALSAEIKSIDNEIDQLVYKLYGLTVEEIKTVESNL